MKTILTLALSALFVASFGEAPLSKEDASFLREANMMSMRAEGREPCDMTTAEKAVVKGGAGCCSAEGAPKPYKLYVKGKGYRFFSCPDEAGKVRTALVSKGQKCGPVQKIAKK